MVSTTPTVARIPSAWTGRMLDVWSDYSYRVYRLYGGYSKYADDWDILSWFSFSCGVDNIELHMIKGDGTGPVIWKKDGVDMPSWGGCGYRWINIPLSEEIRLSWDWYLPSNLYGGSSINGGTRFQTVSGSVYSTERDGR